MNADRKSTILGISAFFHDSAAALIVNGEVVVAVEEERLSRVKHDGAFPLLAIESCLKHASITIEDVDYVVFYEKPFSRFERLIDSAIRNYPFGLIGFLESMSQWLGHKLYISSIIRKRLNYSGEILYVKHHLSHAASSYYCSNFDSAAVLTIDGVGEWDTATICIGRDNFLEMVRSMQFPDSLGLLYSAFTLYLGFRPNRDESKVMGLAAYGNPSLFREQVHTTARCHDDGSITLAMEYFDFERGDSMINDRLSKLFGVPPRIHGSPITQVHKDIAASLQELTEETVLSMARHAHTLTKNRRLCLAGGVALNCTANGKLKRSGLFDDIFIQPAAGDAGGAIGCALYVYYAVLGNPRDKRRVNAYNTYLGPGQKQSLDCLDEVKSIARQQEIVVNDFEENELFPYIANRIAQGDIVGWMSGRMEFGPRALGNRSILADPRVKENWERINREVKYREDFRPFAPAVLIESAPHFFDSTGPSPYMLITSPVLTDLVPAVTHVNKTARIQTLSSQENPRFYKLIQAFAQTTGCPILLNTSLNTRDEPISHSAKDAFLTFIHSNLNILVIENTVFEKDRKHPQVRSLASTDLNAHRHGPSWSFISIFNTLWRSYVAVTHTIGHYIAVIALSITYFSVVGVYSLSRRRRTRHDEERTTSSWKEVFRSIDDSSIKSVRMPF